MKAAKRLKQFRVQCERSASKPASDIELPLLNVLSDICSSLKLNQYQRQQVLGRSGSARLKKSSGKRVGFVDPPSSSNKS